MATISVRDRTFNDKIEVARRLAIYTRQVEEIGHIEWLPNVMEPKFREATHEASVPEEDD